MSSRGKLLVSLALKNNEKVPEKKIGDGPSVLCRETPEKCCIFNYGNGRVWRERIFEKKNLHSFIDAETIRRLRNTLLPSSETSGQSNFGTSTASVSLISNSIPELNHVDERFIIDSLPVFVIEEDNAAEILPTYDENPDEQEHSSTKNPDRTPSTEILPELKLDIGDAASTTSHNSVLKDSSSGIQENRKRKRKAVREEWKVNVAKKLRNNGQKYISKATGKVVEARSLKSPCDSCIFKCTEKFSGEERQTVLSNFWSIGDIDRQREYLIRQVREIKRPSVTPTLQSRSLNFAYYFQKDGTKVRVCKKFFLSTLDISSKVITTARNKVSSGGLVSSDARGKHGKQKRVDESIKEDIRNHIRSIPRVESHYLRANSSREYIDGGRSINDIYRDYASLCKERGKPSGNLTLFSKIFHADFNISFFSPKKDLCEVCAKFDIASKDDRLTLQAEYDRHQLEKELCRNEKQRDKDNPDPNVIACVYDLQAVLPTPNGEISLFYYKSKLATYNLTVYNLKTKEALCNVWNEGEANRGAVEISTCIFSFIKETASKTTEDIQFVFYTDNCSGQQKNKYLLCMYMYAVFKFKNIKKITHKFMIKGHTQNEGDNVHSVIEKQIKKSKKSGPIYVPAQYVQLIRDSKKTQPFYTIKELIHSDFLDFKNLSESLGKNFNYNTDNNSFNFSSIKVLEIDSAHPFKFKYKTSYTEDNFNEVNIYKSRSERRKTGLTKISDLQKFNNDLDSWKNVKAYSHPTGISKNKKNDLMSLLNSGHIPKMYFNFYSDLRVKKVPEKNAGDE